MRLVKWVSYKFHKNNTQQNEPYQLYSVHKRAGVER